MTFDMAKIIESKRAMRRRLRTMPIADKLRMLELLRERSKKLREAGKKRSIGTPP